MRLCLFIIAIGSMALLVVKALARATPRRSPARRRQPAPRCQRLRPRPPEFLRPAIPTGAALGGVLGGPVGATLTDDDRQAAWQAQVGALDSGQKRSWRGC